MSENTTENPALTSTVVANVDNVVFKEQIIGVLNEANKKINDLFATQSKNSAEQIKVVIENQTKIVEQIQTDKTAYKTRFEFLEQQNKSIIENVKMLADKLNEVISKVATPKSPLL